MMSTRRTLLVVMAAAAALLLLSSAAFACVKFRGDLTVTPLATGRTAGNTVTGDGSGTSHVYCTNGSTWMGPTSAGQAASGEQIEVTVAPASACNSGGGNKLSSGWHDVKMVNADGDTTAPFKWNSSTSRWEFQSGKGCWASPSPSGLLTLGSGNPAGLEVNSSGNGAATYTLPSGLTQNANHASSVCVGKGDGFGIIIPLDIV